MMVLAMSMERAEQVGRRSGLLRDVSLVGGPRRKQTGRGDWEQMGLKEPKPMVAVVIRERLGMDEVVLDGNENGCEESCRDVDWWRSRPQGPSSEEGSAVEVLDS